MTLLYIIGLMIAIAGFAVSISQRNSLAALGWLFAFIWVLVLLINAIEKRYKDDEHPKT